MSKSKTPAVETTNPVHTPCAFVADGYTLPFDIPEMAGVSSGITGKRRPMTNRDLSILLDACKPENYKIPPRLPDGMTEIEWLENRIDAARSKGIASQLVEWDVTDHEGNPVAISPENVSRIYPPRLLADLMSVVCNSYVAPDDTNGKPQGADPKN